MFGGPQHIPRPAWWRNGDAAPWAQLDTAEITTDDVRNAVQAHSARTDFRPSTSCSAVLVGLYAANGLAHLVLTRRAKHMRSHSHQVAFPGGKQDPTDRSLWDTALREANEEVALDPATVTFVGELDPFVTVGSNSRVHPLVGLIDHAPKLKPNPDEVELIIDVSLNELARPEVFREEIWTWQGKERAVSFFELDGDTVWGATAAMIRQLLCLVFGIDETHTERRTSD